MTNDQDNRFAIVRAILLGGAALLATGCGADAESRPGSGGSAGMTVTNGGSATGGDSASGGIGGSAGGTGGSAGSGVCNALVNIGPEVHGVSDPDPVPEMTGGTIVDGTYVMTAAVNYGGTVTPYTVVGSSFTLVIAGNTLEFVASYEGGPDVHSTMQQAPSGIQLNATLTCGTGLTDGTYTATPTSLIVRPTRDPAQEDYHVVTFTKQ
jgi:hypothetical protein